MITRDDVAGLRPEEKDAILDALLGIAWADGEVQKEELDLLKKIGRFFTDDDIEGLAQSYKSDLVRVGRKIAKSDLGSKGRKILIQGLAYVAAAAGGLEDTERAFYTQVLRAFGIPDLQRQRIEQQVRESVYADWFAHALQGTGGKLDDATRAGLKQRAKQLQLEDGIVARIEGDVKAAGGVV
jgi:uncharacterized membrane protein YebE (DUF533 family)